MWLSTERIKNKNKRGKNPKDPTNQRILRIQHLGDEEMKNMKKD